MRRLCSSPRIIHSPVLFFFFIFIPFKSFTQQPGGVSGTTLWYVTVKKGNSFTLKDISGHGQIDYSSNTSRNMNFHPALKVPDKEIPLTNFAFNQATVIGIYYPGRNNQETKDFFWFEYLNDSSRLKNKVAGRPRRQFTYGSNTNHTNLEVSGTTTLANAMKTVLYQTATKKTYTNVWGEDKTTRFNADFDGFLPELIVYNRILDSLERAKVQSYLSIKYGTTLDTSYIGSNGVTLWNINDKIIKQFHNRVCAIGKDSAAAIRQPKSNTTYEEGPDDVTAFNRDVDDSTTVDPGWKLIPPTEKPSFYRSLTIGFYDTSLLKIPNSKFIFWGDDKQSIDTSDFKVRYKNQYPNLRAVKRQWLMFNKDKIGERLQFVVAGRNYTSPTLFNTLYDPYDYQLYRFVLIRKKNPEDQVIEKPILNDYFIRKQSKTSVEFNTRAIVWDSLVLNNSSSYNYFSFGKVDILNFLSYTSAFNNTTKLLEYPYHEDSAIRAATHFDTATVIFNYVKEDSLLKFSFKTSVGVGMLRARLFLTGTGKDSLLSTGFIQNPTAPVGNTNSNNPVSSNEDAGTVVLPPSDDNPSNIPSNPPRAKIKYIERRKRPGDQIFREFKVQIPLKRPFNLKSRFLIEITDDLGQITTLPVRLATQPSTN